MDKLKAIGYFMRTVEAGSLAAAARSLDMNPSALSKALGALEREIGYRLFARSTRRLTLTEDGEAYRDCCRELLQLLEDTELAARRGLGSSRGTLRFGLHPALRLALLPRLSEFITAHPDLRLDMVSTNAASALLDQGLDLLLGIGRLSDSSLVARQIGWAQFQVCAAPAYLQHRGRPQRPDDIGSHDAIVYTMRDEDSALRWELRRGEEVRVIAPTAKLAVRDGAGAIDAAIHGCGLARPFELAVRQALSAGRLEAVLPDWQSPREPVFAVLPHARRVPAKVRAFTEFAAALVAPD